MLLPRLRMKSFISWSDTRSDGAVLTAEEELGSALTADFESVFACNTMKHLMGAVRAHSHSSPCSSSLLQKA